MLSTEARVALTLRLIGGLTTDEIARAFLVPEPTIAQRIVRAKRTLAEERVPFEVPRGDELPSASRSVLEVIYLVFNEGYTATAGDDWMRPALCQEALRLGRILAELAPDEPEVHGLVALMEIQASRVAAAHEPDGRADPAARPEPRALGPTADPPRPRGARSRREARGPADGPYVLQAAIAACHARAAHCGRYRLAAHRRRSTAPSPQLAPSPVVELNRAVALSFAFGPDAGLDARRRVAEEPALASYHLLPSVRGDLLGEARPPPGGRGEFERAASLTRNERERELLLKRAAECDAKAGGAIAPPRNDIQPADIRG